MKVEIDVMMKDVKVHQVLRWSQRETELIDQSWNQWQIHSILKFIIPFQRRTNLFQ